MLRACLNRPLTTASAISHTLRRPSGFPMLNLKYRVRHERNHYEASYLCGVGCCLIDSGRLSIGCGCGWRDGVGPMYRRARWLYMRCRVFAAGVDQRDAGVRGCTETNRRTFGHGKASGSGNCTARQPIRISYCRYPKAVFRCNIKRHGTRPRTRAKRARMSSWEQP